ncbi:family 2A encapsulin nanocompartment shell protein, partial [Methylobacter sp.]
KNPVVAVWGVSAHSQAPAWECRLGSSSFPKHRKLEPGNQRKNATPERHYCIPTRGAWEHTTNYTNHNRKKVMSDIHEGQTHTALGDVAARTLANATKTVPMLSTITPRWLVHLLQWKPLEAGIYRVNKVKNETGLLVDCSSLDEKELPQTFVDYEEWGREYRLNAVNTVLDVHTRISDLYSSPHNQIHEQLRLTIETIKERQESELINNAEYGLLNNVAPGFKVQPRTGAPTPDDMDELIARVWKEPAFFLAHPQAIAAFGRECTRRGVPPAIVTLFGSQFLTWRGLPIIPSDKLKVINGKSNILLLRTGESRQGVVGLYQPNLTGELSMGLSVRFMGINHKAIASYLISLYCSLAVLTDDALGVLENVEVGKYHEYK